QVGLRLGRGPHRPGGLGAAQALLGHGPGTGGAKPVRGRLRGRAGGRPHRPHHGCQRRHRRAGRQHPGAGGVAPAHHPLFAGIRLHGHRGGLGGPGPAVGRGARGAALWRLAGRRPVHAAVCPHSSGSHYRDPGTSDFVCGSTGAGGAVPPPCPRAGAGAAAGGDPLTDAWEVIFHINTLTAALRLATPIALAALAGTLSERAGVINLGLEGKLLAGAWAAVYATYLTGAPWVGVLAAVAAGMVVGALLGLFAVGLRANHVVAGVGLNILLLGLTTWLMQVVWDSRGTSPTVAALPRWTIPGLRDVPLLGDLLGSHSPLVYFTLLAAPLLWVVLFKTPVGLRVRMIGEHPEAADTLGIPVHRLQYLSLLAAGGLAALGGAQLALGDLAWFSQNMSAGRGYMALAANVFGQWNPLGSLLASLLFALTDAMQMRIQTLPNPWPTELVQMLPYLLTIAVLSGAVRRSRPPAALGRHYPPEPGAGAP